MGLVVGMVFAVGACVGLLVVLLAGRSWPTSRRNRWLAALVLAGGFGGALLKWADGDTSPPTAEQVEQQRERSREQERQARVDEAARQLADEAKRKDQAEKTRAQRVETLRASYAKLPAQGRRKVVADVCPLDGACDDDALAAVEAAAADPRERAALEDAAMRARSVGEARRAQADRQKFAEDVDRALLAEKRNPRSVTANGSTLRIEMFLCSRQFVSDEFTESPDMLRKLRALGFKRVECSDGVREIVSMDLAP